MIRGEKGAEITPELRPLPGEPVFETASARYGWLNDVVAVGKIAATQEGEDGFVTYDVFAVK